MTDLRIATWGGKPVENMTADELRDALQQACAMLHRQQQDTKSALDLADMMIARRRV